MAGMAKTFTAAELAEETGLQPRTIRHYSFTGLITKPPFRGRSTAYTEENLADVLTVRALTKEGLGAPEVKAAMAKMTLAEIRAKAGLPPVDCSPPTPPVVVPANPAPPPPAPEPRASLGEDWSRVALLPGLELHVRGDAKDFVRKVAREIREKYASA